MRDPLDHVQDLRRGLTHANNVVKAKPLLLPPPELDHLSLELDSFEGLPNDQFRLFQVNGLVQVVVGPLSHRFDG